MNIMLYLVNYANYLYKKSQIINTSTALSIGGFDKAYSYEPKDIDSNFRIQNSHILKKKRGGGYWVWKPYFILKTLEQMSQEDVLFYADSGSYFIRNVEPLVTELQSSSHDILCFNLNFLEKAYTKRDCFILMNMDHSPYTNSTQRLATFILCKKTEFSVFFFNEMLKYSNDPRILTDMKNQLGSPNYPEFIDHRHDQSIFSLLTKKYGIPSLPDPSVMGTYQEKEKLMKTSKNYLVSTRKRNWTTLNRIRYHLNFHNYLH